MKRKNIYTIIGVISLSVLLFVSCGDSQDTFEEFIGQGERITVGKPVDVLASSGNLRAELKVVINADPKIKTVEVEIQKQDGTKELKEFEVVRNNTGVDTLTLLLDDLDEGNRGLLVKLADDVGRNSLAIESSVVVYGPLYQAGLVSRTFESIRVHPDGSATIIWSEPFTELISSQFTYKNGSGELITEELPNNVETTNIPDFMASGGLAIVSEYRPESSIDTFAAPEFKTEFINVEMDRSLWQYVELPDDSELGSGDFSLAAALDGNPNSPGLIRPFSFPNHFSLDLGVETAIGELELTPFSCCGGTFPIMPKRFQLWGIADIADAIPEATPRSDFEAFQVQSEEKGWVKLLDVNVNGSGTDPVVVKVNNETKVRYIRLINIQTFRNADGGNTDTGINNFTLRAFVATE